MYEVPTKRNIPSNEVKVALYTGMMSNNQKYR